VSTINSTTLPLLPIPNGVFFPDMVVTVEAQSPGARAAFEAAAGTDGKELVAVPNLVGTIQRSASSFASNNMASFLAAAKERCYGAYVAYESARGRPAPTAYSM